MRKQTKLVAVLSAAALLAIGASMTSFAAAPHWDREGDEWVYLDRNGGKVTDQWKKSNGQWYYLGDDGYMAKDQVIEEDVNKYYVDANGARVSNVWVPRDNDDLLEDDTNPDDIDTVWMYFDKNGKALDDTLKQLPYGDGQTGYFLFNEDGYMLTGWQTWGKEKENLYYLGSQDEGWALTGWKYLPVDPDVTIFSGLEDDDMYTDESWFYFKPNGRAVVGKTETINGKKYAFDEYGRMSDLWVAKDKASNSLASDSYTNRSGAAASSSNLEGYFRESDGDLLKGDWVQAYVNSDYDSGDDDLRWFYVDSKGKLFKAGVKNPTTGGAKRLDDTSKDDASKDADEETYSGVVELKSIGSSTYLFNDKGVMLTGLFELKRENPLDPNSDVSNVYKGSSKVKAGIYFFNTESGSVTGQMVTNKRVVIDVNGEDQTYYFRSNGTAYQGAIINDYVYDKNGQLVTRFGDGGKYERVDISKIVDPDDDGNYVLKDKNNKPAVTFTAQDDTKEIAVNGNGKIKKTGKNIKDLDEEKMNVSGYKATKADQKSSN